MRHLDIQYCFVQRLYAEKRLTIHKVLGTENPADLLTKYVTTSTLSSMLAQIGLCKCPVDEVVGGIEVGYAVQEKRKQPWKPGALATNLMVCVSACYVKSTKGDDCTASAAYDTDNTTTMGESSTALDFSFWFGIFAVYGLMMMMIGVCARAWCIKRSTTTATLVEPLLQPQQQQQQPACETCRSAAAASAAAASTSSSAIPLPLRTKLPRNILITKFGECYHTKSACAVLKSSTGTMTKRVCKLCDESEGGGC